MVRKMDKKVCGYIRVTSVVFTYWTLLLWGEYCTYYVYICLLVHLCVFARIYSGCLIPQNVIKYIFSIHIYIPYNYIRYTIYTHPPRQPASTIKRRHSLALASKSSDTHTNAWYASHCKPKCQWGRRMRKEGVLIIRMAWLVRSFIYSV